MSKRNLCRAVSEGVVTGGPCCSWKAIRRIPPHHDRRCRSSVGTSSSPSQWENQFSATRLTFMSSSMCEGNICSSLNRILRRSCLETLPVRSLHTVQQSVGRARTVAARQGDSRIELATCCHDVVRFVGDKRVGIAQAVISVVQVTSVYRPVTAGNSHHPEPPPALTTHRKPAPGRPLYEDVILSTARRKGILFGELLNNNNTLPSGTTPASNSIFRCQLEKWSQQTTQHLRNTDSLFRPGTEISTLRASPGEISAPTRTSSPLQKTASEGALSW